MMTESHPTVTVRVIAVTARQTAAREVVGLQFLIDSGLVHDLVS